MNENDRHSKKDLFVSNQKKISLYTGHCVCVCAFEVTNKSVFTIGENLFFKYEKI
jgi:hypothetical protein